MFTAHYLLTDNMDCWSCKLFVYFP